MAGPDDPPTYGTKISTGGWVTRDTFEPCVKYLSRDTVLDVTQRGAANSMPPSLKGLLERHMSHTIHSGTCAQRNGKVKRHSTAEHIVVAKRPECSIIVIIISSRMFKTIHKGHIYADLSYRGGLV